MEYTPETRFLYSYRLITDSVQESRFFCTTSTWNMLYFNKSRANFIIFLRLLEIIFQSSWDFFSWVFFSIIFAGIPTAVAPGGTSHITTALAPIKA